MAISAQTAPQGIEKAQFGDEFGGRGHLSGAVPSGRRPTGTQPLRRNAIDPGMAPQLFEKAQFRAEFGRSPDLAER
jgi:hypothetical protein